MALPPALLVVGEDPCLVSLIEATLGPAGFAVRRSAPGAEAVAALASPGVSLVLLDLRRGPLTPPETEGTRVPVLALVAGDDPGGLARGLGAGVDDFVCDPLRPAELLARAQGLVRGAQARHEAEQRQLRAERYAVLFESAADGIAVFELGGKMLFTNPQALSLVGVSGRPVSEVNLRDFLIEEDRPVIRQLREGFALGVYPHGVDVRLRRFDGPVITVNANFSVLSGGVILTTFRDVTAERAIERELRKTTGFLESVIESSADGIISADLKGTVLLFNRAAERCFGYEAPAVVGKLNVEALYPPGVARQIMKLVRARGGRLEGYRAEMLSQSGERVPVSLSASLIHEGGVVTGSVGVFSDLRERLRIESRLVSIQEELKLREKQSIIAELAGTAAHELNQPLTSVMGYTELLKRRLPADSPAFNTAEIILGEASRMAEIIRKIGTITRYETKSYVGQAKILDLDLASREPTEDTLPPPSPPRSPSSVPPGSPRSPS